MKKNIYKVLFIFLFSIFIFVITSYNVNASVTEIEVETAFDEEYLNMKDINIDGVNFNNGTFQDWKNLTQYTYYSGKETGVYGPWILVTDVQGNIIYSYCFSEDIPEKYRNKDFGIRLNENNEDEVLYVYYKGRLDFFSTGLIDDILFGGTMVSSVDASLGYDESVVSEVVEKGVDYSRSDLSGGIDLSIYGMWKVTVPADQLENVDLYIYSEADIDGLINDYTDKTLDFYIHNIKSKQKKQEEFISLEKPIKNAINTWIESDTNWLEVFPTFQEMLEYEQPKGFSRKDKDLHYIFYLGYMIDEGWIKKRNNGNIEMITFEEYCNMKGHLNVDDWMKDCEWGINNSTACNRVEYLYDGIKYLQGNGKDKSLIEDFVSGVANNYAMLKTSIEKSKYATPESTGSFNNDHRVTVLTFLTNVETIEPQFYTIPRKDEDRKLCKR